MTSQDNPWSGADVSQWIDCKRCGDEWRLTGSIEMTLTLRSSEVAYDAASRKESLASNELHDYLKGLGQRHLAGIHLPSKKAELEYLKARNAFGGSYRNYLEARKTKSMADVAHFAQSSEYATWLVKTYGDARYPSLVVASQEAKVASMEARKLIVRRKVEERSLFS